MTAQTRETFQLGVPLELRADLEAAMREAAAEEGCQPYEVASLDPADVESELQFEPGTVLVILKFVFEAAAAALVGRALDKLMDKLKARPDGKATIVVVYPDGEVERIDTADKRQTDAAIKRLTGKP
jgi:hypothetical protein